MPEGIALHWTELALKKAGCGSREEFQRKNGLNLSGRWDLPTCRALWPWLPGYVLHRMEPGQTLYQVAQRYGSSVQQILAANCGLKDRPLLPGQAVQVPLDCMVVPWDAPFGSQMQEIFLEGLQARCPYLEAKALTKTAGSRTVWALRLGTGPRRVLLTAGHHANEYITSVLLWRLLEDYCRSIREDVGLFGFSGRMLFRRTSLYLVPLVNPDGVDLVAGEIEPGSREYTAAQDLAATQPQVPFPSGWKANLQGVDLNLNYPAQWERVKARKPRRPGPRDYPGPSPLSQPETMALADYVRRIHPDLLAAWHTQGGEIYAADGQGRIPDENLARKLASASGYQLCSVPPESEGGGLRDWFLQETGKPAFTIEAGRGENPLPMEDLRQLYEENLPIFALLLAG